MITRESILNAFDVDMESGRMFWKNPSKYHREKTGKEAGIAQRGRHGKTYWVIRWNGSAHKRGRLIFFLENGGFPEPCVDHINGDSLDDRPENLRQATVMQNSWNHKGRAKRQSHLPMGVRINAGSGSYSARLCHNKKMIHLGSFDTPDQASRAYQLKRKEMYGEFA